MNEKIDNKAVSLINEIGKTPYLFTTGSGDFELLEDLVDCLARASFVITSESSKPKNKLCWIDFSDFITGKGSIIKVFMVKDDAKPSDNICDSLKEYDVDSSESKEEFKNLMDVMTSVLIDRGRFSL